jgi:hypothetical protein
LSNKEQQNEYQETSNVEVQLKNRVTVLEIPPWPLLSLTFITGVSIVLDGVFSCGSSISIGVVSTGTCLIGDGVFLGGDGVFLGGDGVFLGVLIGDFFLLVRDELLGLAMVDRLMVW